MDEVLRVKVVDSTKDGLSFNYKIHTVTNMDKCFSEPEMTTVRVYEDLQWLHVCIEQDEKSEGSIIPPLPNRPDPTTKGALARSKELLGGESRVISEDVVQRYCKAMERYLQILARHHAFRYNENFHRFLDTKELPAAVKTKKAWMKTLTHAVQEVKLHGHKDADEFFSEQRSFIIQSCMRLRESSLAYSKMVTGEYRLSSTFSNLVKHSSLAGSSQAKNDKPLHGVLVKFSEGLDHCRSAAEERARSDDFTLGFVINLYEKYSLKAKAVLHHRMVLLHKKESTEKALEKSTKNRDDLEEKRDQAEAKFVAISKTTRHELTQYQEQRVKAFQEFILQHAERHIAIARQLYAQLNKTIADLDKIDIE